MFLCVFHSQVMDSHKIWEDKITFGQQQLNISVTDDAHGDGKKNWE